MEQILERILNELQALRSDVQDLKEGQKRLENDVTGLKEGQKRLENDVTGLKEGQKRLETDVADLKRDVNDLKKGQERLETKMDHVTTEMRSHFKHIENILESHQKVFEVVSDEMKSMRIDIEYLSGKTGKHDTEIHNLKKRFQS
jgi:chromosome segregation ATPase